MARTRHLRRGCENPCRVQLREEIPWRKFSSPLSIDSCLYALKCEIYVPCKFFTSVYDTLSLSWNNFLQLPGEFHGWVMPQVDKYNGCVPFHWFHFYCFWISQCVLMVLVWRGAEIQLPSSLADSHLCHSVWTGWPSFSIFVGRTPRAPCMNAHLGQEFFVGWAHGVKISFWGAWATILSVWRGIA